MCFASVWVWRECCNTAYGPSGLVFCWGGRLNFETCCPTLEHRWPPPPANTSYELVGSRWEGDDVKGCSSIFPWAPTILYSQILSGPAYHPDTGEHMSDFLSAGALDSDDLLTADFAQFQNQTSADQEAGRQLRWDDHFASRSPLGFQTLLKGADDYIRQRDFRIDTFFTINEILGNFGDSLNQCAPAAIVAASLKVEMLFDRDLTVARLAARQVQLLAERIEKRLEQNMHKGPKEWQKVADEVINRVIHLNENRHSLMRPAMVDFVVPLCSADEIDALARSLSLAFSSVAREFSEPADPNEGFEEGSWRARNVRAHTQVRGRFRHAQFSLHVYSVCGDLMYHDMTRPTSAAELSKLIFGSSSKQVKQLFGAKAGLPHVYLRVVEEEVPTGDVAAYLQHLAQASAQNILANITLLLHPDFMEHIRLHTIKVVLGALANGAWPHNDVKFLHLGWRHEGPLHDRDRRVSSHLHYHCKVQAPGGAKLGPCDPAYNPHLLENLWRMAFGRQIDPGSGDDMGAYDFSQILVSRSAVMLRPPAYWRYLSQAVSAKSSYELLPGTRFISRKVDLTTNHKHNKGVCIWFEHLWHLLFDSRFFPDQREDPATKAKDYRSFTHLGDPSLPLGIRLPPDSVIARHYWLNAEQQCLVLRDHMGCRLLKLERDRLRQVS